MNLGLNDLVTFQAQKDPGGDLDGNVDAALLGDETALLPGVGCIDDCVRGQRGDKPILR
jgi:hypothetical protein